MNNSIMKSAASAFNKVAFKAKKHSPEILMVTGIVGAVGSAVMACKATLKVNDILDETKETVDKIHGVLESDAVDEDTYSEEDSKKDLAVVYAQTGWKFVKLYAPSVIMGALSITSILASNNILRKRSVALAAAYTAIDQSFKDYRGRVVERFGEVVDRELKYNLKAEKITEKVLDKETGKEKKVKNTIEVAQSIDGYSDYARFFDDGCASWEKDAESNLYFLRTQQQYANDLLVARGHLFLNEVYDMLGIPRTKAGQVVGWIYDSKNPIGDNYVDFGIYDISKQEKRDFVNGYERSILLDFNVDGPIYDLI